MAPSPLTPTRGTFLSLVAKNHIAAYGPRMQYWLNTSPNSRLQGSTLTRIAREMMNAQLIELAPPPRPTGEIPIRLTEAGNRLFSPSTSQ